MNLQDNIEAARVPEPCLLIPSQNDIDEQHEHEHENDGEVDTDDMRTCTTHLPSIDLELNDVHSSSRHGTHGDDGHDDLIGMPFVTATEDDEFDLTCQLAIRLAIAAMKYGSTADKVEPFLENLMHRFGFEGVFRVSTSVLLCSFQRQHPVQSGGMAIHTQIVPIKVGYSLNKLGLLSDLATDVLDHDLGLRSANGRLDEIDSMSDPWGIMAQLAAFAVTGPSLATIFQGSWWDVGASIVTSLLTFGTVMFFQRLPKRFAAWINFAASFSSAMVALLWHRLTPGLDPLLVTLTGVVVLVPGGTITLGITDLVSGHIVSGFSRFIQGCVEMLWLVVGYWLADNIVQVITGDEVAASSVSDSVPPAWQALFIPVVCVAVTVIFQCSPSDMPWAVLCMGFAYCTALTCNLVLQNPSLGTFASAVLMTIFANCWSRWTDRPNTIVLMPAFLLTVSGTVGFRGLSGILEGDDDGTEQFLQMFVVAGLIIAGMLTGSTIVPPETTI